MLTVHHLRIFPSERIVWLCEELGIEYDLNSTTVAPTTGWRPKTTRPCTRWASHH